MREVTSSVYVVAWHDDGIVKVGFTSGKRWARFVSRGAVLVSLTGYPSADDAFAAELALEARLASIGRPAFSSRDESLSHLPGGCGWSECFRVDSMPEALQILRLDP